MDIIIKAISPNNQKLVNKAYNKSRQYHEAINHASENNLSEDTPAIEKVFNDGLLLLLELSVREKANFDKQYNRLHNYKP